MKEYQADNLVPQTGSLHDWVLTYTGRLYAWALSRTSDPELSEDLVQDTFLAAAESFHRFEGKSEPLTWLTAILKNKLASHFKKSYASPVTRGKLLGERDPSDAYFTEAGEWRHEQSPQEWLSADANLLDDPEFLKTWTGCIDKLPGDWRAVIQLKYVLEQKGTLICQDLNISPTNFWQILHRAKLQLRKCLELHWFKI